MFRFLSRHLKYRTVGSIRDNVQFMPKGRISRYRCCEWN